MISVFSCLSYILATSEDYKLLETLNKLTINKYDEMSTSTKTLITKMEEINEKCKLFFFDGINVSQHGWLSN